MKNHTPLEEAGKEYFFDLRNILIDFLSIGTWSFIEERFAHVGLEWRPDLSPGWGKPQYVSRVLAEMSEEDIVELAKRCINKSQEEEVYAIQDALWWYQSAGRSTLSRVTRDRLLESLDGQRLHPSIAPIEFLKTFPQLKSTFSWNSSKYYYTNGNQLMRDRSHLELYGLEAPEEKVRPCSHKELLEEYNFSKWSDPRVFEFLERLVHPEIRKEEDQRKLVEILNKQLIRDGFKLECTSFISGYSVYSVEAITTSSSETPKYLIFASNGPKPEIGFEDAVSNKIAILKHEESCLVYDRPIDRNSGLLWEDLVKWWQNTTYFAQTNKSDPRVSLGQRLLESMPDSPPERYLFVAYFYILRPIYTTNLPALIPQVYVHYDPITISALRKRGDSQRFERQRMDFLLLLPQGTRVILEVDGIQHYSINNEPSPITYAVTVRSDRELHLLGYDVYRFAGIELDSKEKAQKIVEKFFLQLFDKHGITKTA